MGRWLLSPSMMRCAAVLAIALCAGALFAQTALYQRLSGWTTDAQHRLLGPVLDMADVIVVDIDEESIASLESSTGSWPYGRDLYAGVLRDLFERGARTVVFDILFSEQRVGDDEFARELNENVVLAAASFSRPPARDEDYLRRFARLALAPVSSPLLQAPGVEQSLPAHRWPDITAPLAPFVESGRARVGVISVQPDEDGVLRRLPLFHQAYGYVLPSLALAGWASMGDLASARAERGQVHIKERAFPVSQDGAVSLRYPRATQNLKVIPFHHLVRSGYAAPSAAGLDAQLAGKTVFIGSSSILFGDYVHTPLGRMSGLLVSAMARQSLVHGHVMRPLPLVLWLCLFVLAMAPAILLSAREEPLPPFGLTAGSLATLGLPTAAGMALFAAGWESNWIMAVLCGCFGMIVIVGHGVVRMHTEQRRLFFERRAAQEANRLKSEFLAHMAHELRTPLTAIIGFNKINQLDDRLNAKQRIENSAIIARNCEHLLKLINDNLDHAKIEAGQMEVIRKPESIELLVSDVVATLRPMAIAKGLRLDARYDQPLPVRVSMDAFRVRQVLLNLVGNAIKFTEQGRVEVLVRWRSGLLDITVVDTGPGIERAVSERVFGAFQQGDAPVPQRQVGTGLGLTIARSLARLMGGDIELDSWKGQGSRFRFYLQAPEAQYGELVAEPPMAPADSNLSGRVLLAEDDEDIRELMRRELTALGLSVHPVRNGLEGVHAIQQQRFDLVLMDLEMPIMGGLEAVQVIRESGRDLPILAMTAHSQGPETEAALSGGFNEVLSKPVPSALLNQRLAAYLGTTPRPDNECTVAPARLVGGAHECDA